MIANKAEATLENSLIYPSAHNPCILRCVHDNGHPMCTLYLEHSLDTQYVQLAFTDKIYTEEETLFRCDYVEARDGGLPFLTIVDVMKVGSENLTDVKPLVRLELVKLLLNDKQFFDVDSPTNEFRVRAPTIFDVAEITDVFTSILPSFYGVVNGIAFVKDKFPSPRKNDEDHFIIRKTRKSEVYELYLNGVQPAPGNNIAYVPTMDLSRKLKAFLQHRNSAKIRCVFQEDRQKWVPVL